MSPNEATRGQRGPVGRQTPEHAHEDLQTILGAAPVVVAALTPQVSGYILLLLNDVVADQPRGFVSRSVDLGSPPLVVSAPTHWEFRLPDRSPRFGLPGVPSSHLVIQRRFAALLPELSNTLSPQG